MKSYQELQDEVRRLEGQPIKEGSEEVWSTNYNSIGYMSNEDVIKALLPDLFKNFDKVRKSGQKWHSFVVGMQTTGEEFTRSTAPDFVNFRNVVVPVKSRFV